LGTNIVTIQGIGVVRTILITKKLGAQTKRVKILVSYDFHFRISNGKEDVMFVTKLDLFSIGTIKIPIQIEPVSKPYHILNLNIIFGTKKKQGHCFLCCSKTKTKGDGNFIAIKLKQLC
jgi:hypothetical protein